MTKGARAAVGGTVHIVPTGNAYIPGVPAVEQDVTPERAAELLAFKPAAFTTTTELPAAPAEPAVEPDDDSADEPKE